MTTIDVSTLIIERSNLMAAVARRGLTSVSGALAQFYGYLEALVDTNLITKEEKSVYYNHLAQQLLNNR